MYEHIAEYRRKLMLLSDLERKIAIYGDIWVDYPKWKIIQNTIDTILKMPPRKQAMCLLVSGVSGMGKTSILDRIQRYYCPQRGSNESSIATLELKAEAEHKKFKSLVFSALSGNINYSEKNVTDEVILSVVRAKHLKALAIDEIQNVTLAHKVDITKNLVFLRGLSGSPFHLSIVGLGNERAVNTLRSDRQLFRRFEQHVLEPWQESLEFRAWLAGFQATLPLKNPSRLQEKAYVLYILGETDGITDSIVKLVGRAAIWSIVQGCECVTMEMLKLARNELPPL